MQIINLRLITILSLAGNINPFLLCNNNKHITKVGRLFSNIIFKMMNENKWNAEKLTDSDIGDTITLVSNAFSYDAEHSWSRALNLPPSNFASYASGMVPDYINKYPYSIGVKKSSVLHGVILHEDFINTYKPVVENNNEINNSYKPIEEIIRSCQEIFISELYKRKNEVYDNDILNKYCYIAWIAVNQNSQNQGIANILLSTSTKHLEQLQYKYAIAFCSSPRSTRAFLRDGYEVWGYITYKDYILDNNKPFSILPDEVSVVVKCL
jgi:hypothetical protein